MSELKADQEPSIEEILESIRQIISEEGDPDAKQGGGAAPKPEAAAAAKPAAPATPSAPKAQPKDVPLSLTPDAAAKPAVGPSLDLSSKAGAPPAASSLDLSSKAGAPPAASSLDLSSKAGAPPAASSLDLSSKADAKPAASSLDLSSKPAAKPVDADVLDLTNMVAPSPPKPAAPQQPAVAVAPPPPKPAAPPADITIDMMDKPMDVPMTTNAPPADTLVSAQTAQTATDSLSKLLAGNVAIEKDRVGAAGPVTLEDIAREMMMPIIKTWLDQNLPAIIERVVQKEVEKLARRATER